MRRIPPWGVLAALVAVSAALRFWGALGIPAPWIAADEMIYAELGRSLWESGRFDILGASAGFYTLVYPLFVGLPLSLSDIDLGYSLLKALQALVMSLAAVPVFLWARSFVSHWAALFAAALTLAIPGLAYSGLVMTEVAFYPVMVLAAWRLARALEVPSRANQAWLVGAVLLAAATRLQAAVLLPVLVTAAILHALFARAPRRALAVWPAAAALAGVSVLWTLWRLVEVGRLASIFGAYEAAGRSRYTIGGILEWVVYHVGDAILFTGVVPACAFVLLLVPAVRGQERSEPVLAYLATTAALAFWLIVEVGTFASRHVNQLAERDLLALAPPLFVGYALWLDRGAPKTRLAASLVALGVATFVALLPLDRLVTLAAIPDAFTVAPLQLLRRESGLGAVQTVVFGLTVLAVVAFALLPRRAQLGLAAVVLLTLGAASAVATDVVSERARNQSAVIIGADKEWIDSAASGAVAFLYDGDRYWNMVWEHVFWNRDIDAVYRLPGARRIPGPLPQPFAKLLPDGRLLGQDDAPIAGRFVVAAPSWTFDGAVIAKAIGTGYTKEGLQLWRLFGDARVATSRTGITAGGDIYGHGRLVVYGCTPGAFESTLIAKGTPLDIALRRNGDVYQRLLLASAEIARVSIPVEPQGLGEQCEFDVEVAGGGIVGSTRFEFVTG